MKTTSTRKQRIVGALRTWIKQRPGLDYRNYGNPVSYRSEQRRIARQLGHTRPLLAAVEYDDAITADDIIDAARHAYSGRLNIVETVDDVVTIDYCAGQYWPTEYRAAVCAVLAYALWACERDRMAA